MSFIRYELVLRKQMVEDWKRHVLFTLVMMLIFFMTFWSVNWIVGMMPETESAMSGSDIDVKSLISVIYKFAIFIGVTSIAVAYQSAHSMPFMRSKGLQTQHAVLPASNVEKYGVVLTVSLVISALESVIALLIADLFQYLMTGLSFFSQFSSVDFELLLKTVPDVALVRQIVTLLICVSVMSIFLSSGWFTLSATVFRKHPFLMGVLIYWGISQLLNIALYSYSQYLMNFLTMVSAHFQGITDVEALHELRNASIVLFVAMAVLTLVFWFWGYKRMSKSEL